MIKVRQEGKPFPRAYYLNLGSISTGSTATPFHLVINRGAYPARWNKLTCAVAGSALAASLKQVTGKEWRLTLAPKSVAVLGWQSYMLRFSFYSGDRELAYHLLEPVNFNVQGPISLVPESIFFGAVKSGSTVTKKLQLVVRAGESGAAGIISVKSTVAGRATASVIDGGTGLKVELHALNIDGRSDGRFLITAEYGGSLYKFRVDYLAYVSGRKEAK
jgi:hypothetical protein